MTQPGIFISRALRATFTTTAKPFSDGSTKLVFSGLRMTVRISDANGNTGGQMTCGIWGLTEAHINDIFFETGPPWESTNKGALTVLLESSEGGAAWVTVWNGTVLEARADYNMMPEVPLMVTGWVWFQPSIDGANAHHFPGAVDVAAILKQIASDGGFAFRNDGFPATTVTGMTTNGSTAAQIAAVAGAVPNLDYGLTVDGLVIWAADKGRSDALLTIGADTGLIGYPVISMSGLMFRCRFRQGMIAGQTIRLDTQIARAKGTWIVNSWSHALDCEMPGGLWETEIVTRPGGSLDNPDG